MSFCTICDGKYFRVLLAVLGLVALIVLPQESKAGEVADALHSLAADSTVQGQISLDDIGFRTSVLLNDADPKREIYFPVPPGIPLMNAVLDFDGRYSLGEGGKATFTLSLDGYAVSARSMTGEAGDASLRIGVDGAPRSGGFVRLGLAWSSAGVQAGENDPPNGNVLEVFPSTRLTYRYDTALLKDIFGVWAVLPHSVAVLIAQGPLSKESYETAWRTGLALERTGKQVTIKTLPAPGDLIDLSGTEVPQGLLQVPAFAALAGRGQHTIANQAEAGALLVLGGLGLRSDIVIIDDALLASIDLLLETLREQISSVDSSSDEAFSSLRTRKFSFGRVEGMTSQTARPGTFMGRGVIAIASGNGSEIPGLFEDLGRRTALARQAVVNGAALPLQDAGDISSAVFGSAPTQLGVSAVANWRAEFDLGGAGSAGKVPSYVDIDISASGAPDSAAIAVVFLNDNLLEAKRLKMNGKQERVSARIPLYALQQRNTLRVEFKHQSDDAFSVLTVNVLPSSRIHLEPAPPARDFAGLAPWFAGDVTLFAPDSWLEQPIRTLPVMIRVADAGGVAPARALLSMGDVAVPIKPTGPFVAFDAKVQDVSPLAEVKDNHLVLADANGRIAHAIKEFDELAIIHVAEGSKYSGMIYQTAGSRPMQINEPFRLQRGNLALIGKDGVLLELDTRNETAELSDDPRSMWFRNTPWMIPVAAMAGFLLLLILARRAQRRHSSSVG